MGIRERANESPRAVAVATGVVLLILAAFIWSQLRTPSVVTDVGQAYFTVDDGKTTFADTADKRTPFTHEGKEAVRAVMFACDPQSKDRFVGYLERSDLAGGTAGRPGAGGPATQIRRAGETKWVGRYSPEGTKILSVRCPAGGTAEPRQVLP